VNRLGRQCSDVPECSLASQNQVLKTAVIRECVDNLQKVQKVAPEGGVFLVVITRLGRQLASALASSCQGARSPFRGTLDKDNLAELPGSQNKFSVIGGMVAGCSRLEVGCYSEILR
jgi:hypothetical protein